MNFVEKLGLHQVVCKYRETKQSIKLLNSSTCKSKNSFSRIGVKVWNEIPQALRNLSKNAFKRKLKQILFNILGSQDSYIDLSQIIKNVKPW